MFNILQECISNKREPKKKKITTVPYPAVLPKLNSTLLKYYNDGKVLENSQSFVYEWGTHLLEVTNGEPTSKDCENFARTVVDTYPELKGGKTPFVS